MVRKATAKKENRPPSQVHYRPKNDYMLYAVSCDCVNTVGVLGLATDGTLGQSPEQANKNLKNTALPDAGGDSSQQSDHGGQP
jgi:hypothetical protein